MRNWNRWTGFALAIILCGCSPRTLERQGVEIAFGMRLNDLSDHHEISPNLAKLREIGMRKLVVELPLVADSMGLPSTPVGLPSDFSGLANRFKVELGLAFCSTNKEELFPSQTLPSMESWFAALDSAIRRNLRPMRLQMPVRVIVGGHLDPLLAEPTRWKSLLEGLRMEFPETKFSVGSGWDHLQAFAALSDEVAVDYKPIAGPDQKAESRTFNTAVAALADSLNKPIYIFRANIMGDDPVTQMKNRLRFWAENDRIHGICLNTLYPRIAPRDSSPYYGMATRPELVEYLQAYKLEGYE